VEKEHIDAAVRADAFDLLAGVVSPRAALELLRRQIVVGGAVAPADSGHADAAREQRRLSASKEAKVRQHLVVPIASIRSSVPLTQAFAHG
jgi:hypothetical protein